MNIILTLTTVPNRLLDEREGYGTKEGLKTIVGQSYHAYEVHFNVPRSYGELPEWLESFQMTYPHLQVFRTNDYGPVTKILPTLERGGEPNDLIITVDDDLYYEDGLIPAHLEARKRYPDCAIGFAGMDEIGGMRRHFVTSYPDDCRVKILEGYKTVSYLRNFFDVDEFKREFALKVWQDDHAISAYMGYKNIKKMVLGNKYSDDYRPRVESFPVIKHTKIEAGGCKVFRSQENKKNEEEIQNFYRLGYLER